MNTASHKIYIGIDVCKKHLDVFCSFNNVHFQVENNLLGIRKIITTLKKHPIELVNVGMESTGGYEKLVAKTLMENQINVSVINPRMIRDFAKASGKLAKTDQVDAKIIASYCEKMSPPSKEAFDEKHEEIAELTTRRDQLVQMIIAEKNRLEKAPKHIRKLIIRSLKFLKKELALIEHKLKKAIKEHKKLAEKQALLTTIKGIGEVTANALIAHLPELGMLDNKQIAALSGLAPFNCDSGKMRGKRCIWGGRAAVRTCLYMATMASIRSNAAIKNFYNRLIAKGKARMVALTACMRKLLIIANAIISKNQPWQPNFNVES